MSDPTAFTPDNDRLKIPQQQPPATLRIGVLAGTPDLHLVSVLGGEGKAPIFRDAALAEALTKRGLKVRLTSNELTRAGTN